MANDILNEPYKVQFQIDTYPGNWTAEEIDRGLAGEPVTEIRSQWFRRNPNGDPIEITNLDEIAKLEAKINGVP